MVLEYSLLCCINNFLLKRLNATINGNNGHAAINPVVLMYIRTDELCHFYAWYNLSCRRVVDHIRTVLHTQLKHQSSILLALGDRTSRFPSQSVIGKGFSSHGVIMPRANVTSSDKRSTPWALIYNHLFFYVRCNYSFMPNFNGDLTKLPLKLGHGWVTTCIDLHRWDYLSIPWSHFWYS